jgi:uncharacterized protein YbjT (DUF2867 family)
MMTTVVVFGGAGFLGRRLVDRLTAEGMAVRVAVRHPDPARIELRAIGFDRVAVVSTDVRPLLHVQGGQTVAREAVAAGVARLVLVSGIGADADSLSPYIRARGRGEQVVQQTFPAATIVRPGAMFGTLAELALRLLGGGAGKVRVRQGYGRQSGNQRITSV